MRKSRIPLMVTCAVLFFFYLPIIVLMISSFDEARYSEMWGGFSFRWYVELFRDRQVWQALRNSLIVGASATVISTILGTMAAFALHHYHSRLQKLHYGMIYSPLVIPDILMGMSLLVLFISLNISLNLFTVFIAHTTFCMSYVTIVVLARLQSFDFSVVEAAQDLGAGWRIIIWRILAPLLAPGIISGALLAFTMSIDDFIITFFVAGPGSTTLPLYVYGMIKFGSTPIINALSTLLLTFTFVFVCIAQRLTKETSL